MLNFPRALLGLVLSVCVMSPVEAQIAVFDFESFLQLQEEVAYWRQQLAAMQYQVTTAKQQLASTTGNRNMGFIQNMSNSQRNYLPTAVSGISPESTIKALGSRPVGAAFDQALRDQSVLTPAITRELSKGDLAVVQARRASSAARAAMMQVAIAAASDRFTAIQGLINQIDRAPDSKASMDLQARISAEVAMTINETAKLSALSSWNDSTMAALQTQIRETASNAHGLFTGRFHPTTP